MPVSANNQPVCIGPCIKEKFKGAWGKCYTLYKNQCKYKLNKTKFTMLQGSWQVKEQGQVHLPRLVEVARYF